MNQPVDWKTIRRIMFVCHGNICRSAMAECVMTKLLADAGLSHITVDSSATSTEEIGNPIHYGAAASLRRHAIPVLPHRARQLRPADADKYDIFFGADTANITNMKRILGPAADTKCLLLMDVAGQHRSIADPWYTGDFEATWNDVFTACSALAKLLCPPQCDDCTGNGGWGEE